MESAQVGDVLVIDNNGCTDEGCIGDLTALEARASKLAGIVVWGTHRDTPELRQIGFPILVTVLLRLVHNASTPRTDDALSLARFGDFDITKEDIVFADDDGCVFVSANSAEQLIKTAGNIRQVERTQADRIKTGELLRQQLKFAEYLKKRAVNPDQTFRQHLREVGGAIEE